VTDQRALLVYFWIAVGVVPNTKIPKGPSGTHSNPELEILS
jgi:hypothetical protein